MEWRCEWCGKPHEENDPPCDNCGHGKFEKAIVQQTDLAAEGPETTMVWVCTECGREHPKHSPPCSRCGGGPLERQEKGVDASELEAPGYLDLLTPKYAATLAVVLVFAGIFVLGLIGVIDLPGVGESGVPDVADVPGNDSAVNGHSFTAAEADYLSTLDERRATEGTGTLEREARLAEIAVFYNQRWVKSVYGDATVPRDRARALLSDECGRDPLLIRLQVTPEEYQSAETLAQAIASESITASSDLLTYSAEKTGMDLHAGPDGTVFVTQFVC